MRSISAWLVVGSPKLEESVSSWGETFGRKSALRATGAVGGNTLKLFNFSPFSSSVRLKSGLFHSMKKLESKRCPCEAKVSADRCVIPRHSDRKINVLIRNSFKASYGYNASLAR